MAGVLRRLRRTRTADVPAPGAGGEVTPTTNDVESSACNWLFSTCTRPWEVLWTICWRSLNVSGASVQTNAFTGHRAIGPSALTPPSCFGRKCHQRRQQGVHGQRRTALGQMGALCSSGLVYKDFTCTTWPGFFVGRWYRVRQMVLHPHPNTPAILCDCFAEPATRLTGLYCRYLLLSVRGPFAPSIMIRISTQIVR